MFVCFRFSLFLVFRGSYYSFRLDLLLPSGLFYFFQHTKNISYDPEKLPEKIRTSVSGLLKKLLNLVETDSLKPESRTLATGGSLPKPLNVTAKAVKYGFKAPVAMTLGPYWAYLLKDFKMLHVEHFLRVR